MVAKRKQVNKQSKNLKKEPKHKIIKNLSKTENQAIKAKIIIDIRNIF